MLIRAFARALALASVAVSVAACEYSPTTVDRTIAYNQAISDSTNNLFLLNAVRAYQRQPTYYTRNTTNTSTGTVTPTVSGVFPWGSTPTNSVATATSSNPTTNPALATGQFQTLTTVTRSLTKAALNLTASLTGTTSNQLTLTNLDDQPSMQGLLTPVTLQQISNYLNEGFSPQELYFLYMESISVPEPILQNLPNAIAENCAIRLYEPPANELSQMDNDKDPLLLPQRTPTTIQDSYCRYFFGQSWIDSYKIKPNHKVSAEMARLMKAIRPALKELPLDGYIVNSTPKLRFPKFEANAVVSGHHSSECFDGGAISAGSPQDTVDEYGDKVASRNGDRAAKAATLANLRLKAKNISDQLDAAEKAGQNSAADEAKAKSLAIELDKIQYGLGQLVGTSSPIKSQTFVNDPAVFDVTPEGKIIDSRHFTCFKQVLTALLALDISPTPGSPKALYRVPMDYAKDNSRYLADLSQQSLSVGEVSRSPADPKKQPDKFDPTKQFEQIGACKKADDLTIGVAADGYVKALFSLGYDADDKTATLSCCRF